MLEPFVDTASSFESKPISVISERIPMHVKHKYAETSRSAAIPNTYKEAKGLHGCEDRL